MESVAAFGWNRWQLWRGIGGRLRLESVAALAWNTQEWGASKNLKYFHTNSLACAARLLRDRFMSFSRVVPWDRRPWDHTPVHHGVCLTVILAGVLGLPLTSCATTLIS